MAKLNNRNKIDHLNLTRTTINKIKKFLGITRIAGLRKTTRSELSAIVGFGPRTINKIGQELKRCHVKSYHLR